MLAWSTLLVSAATKATFKLSVYILDSQLLSYCRTGFSCENLIIANCEFFSSSQTFDLLTSSINSPPLVQLAQTQLLICSVAKQKQTQYLNYAIKTGPTVLVYLTSHIHNTYNRTRPSPFFTGSCFVYYANGG